MLESLVELGIFLGMPAILVGISASVAWSQLTRPWLFLVVCLLVLYALYLAMFYFAAPASVISMDSIVRTDNLQASGHSTITVELH
ncbi:hypothetical protein I5R65_08060 [Herbaspirillum sp. AP02]|uniref:hypothetical protein n=1 Tax=unclassified Herbaspirillum TaxID=2624150 RepID=UPI0015DB62F2|nr:MULTISPECIES: hypothetical protein [unclassified Herbaspirillum]MBG7619416.1 hypothetical protein [Herbaspirillum sp. AP02]NZD66700.1 hypothetical protein [Herbaspirillum sp. AP21]HCF4815080.1 hypothetical protein [Pseudomonas aeruginosa]